MTLTPDPKLIEFIEKNEELYGIKPVGRYIGEIPKNSNANELIDHIKKQTLLQAESFIRENAPSWIPKEALGIRLNIEFNSHRTFFVISAYCEVVCDECGKAQ